MCREGHKMAARKLVVSGAVGSFGPALCLASVKAVPGRIAGGQAALAAREHQSLEFRHS